MTRARQNANISPAVGRNMVINGSMNVAARSSSVASIGTATGYFTCDRWKYAEATDTAGRLTMSQTSDGPNGISANCLKLDCTTADTSIAAGEFIRIQQVFEGQNLQRIGKGVAGAKQITVSFYVKANAALTFACELYDANNGRQISKLFNTTTSWSRIELTFPADVDDGSSPFNDDNGRSLDLSFIIHAGSDFTSGTLNSSSWANLVQANRAAGIDSFFSSTDNNFFITGVQMEVGPVATDFEQEDISTTIAKCQRYFERRGTDLNGWEFISDAGQLTSATNYQCAIRFNEQMRAAPTMYLTGTLSNLKIIRAAALVTITGITASDNTNGRTLLLYGTCANSGGSAGEQTRIQTITPGTWVNFDAEL